jgi:hypothetical protein
MSRKVGVVDAAVGPAASSSSEPEPVTTKATKRAADEADADPKRKRVGKLAFKKAAGAGSSEKAAPDAKAAALAAFEAKQREQKQKQSERHDKFAMFKFNDKAAET